MSFATAFDQTDNFEGGYVNDPDDAGGETNRGVTVAVARANGYLGAMKDIPDAEVRRIAKSQFWDVLKLDDICLLSQPIANEMFDTGYHSGPSNSGIFLQEALNVLNAEEKKYPDLVADGLVGPMTISALRAFLQWRGLEGEKVLLKALNCQQGAYYITITGKRKKNEKYIYGWFLKRISIG